MRPGQRSSSRMPQAGVHRPHPVADGAVLLVGREQLAVVKTCLDSSCASACAGAQMSSSWPECGICHIDTSRTRAATARDERRSQARAMRVQISIRERCFP